MIERKVLTAKAPAKNLKEHEEAFKSVNGFEEIPPADPNTEISGVIAGLMQHPTLTKKEIAAAAFRIRSLSEKRLKYGHASNMIYRALGYEGTSAIPPSTQDAVPNLNYIRKDLASVNNEIIEDAAQKYRAIKEIYQPYMDLLATLPDDSEFMDQWRNVREIGKVTEIAVLFLERHKLPIFEKPALWDFAVVLVNRYRKVAAANTRKKMGRIKGRSKMRCNEVLRDYAVSIHGEWWLRPGEEESDD